MYVRTGKLCESYGCVHRHGTMQSRQDLLQGLFLLITVALPSAGWNSLYQGWMDVRKVTPQNKHVQTLNLKQLRRRNRGRGRQSRREWVRNQSLLHSFTEWGFSLASPRASWVMSAHCEWELLTWVVSFIVLWKAHHNLGREVATDEKEITLI